MLCAVVCFRCQATCYSTVLQYRHLLVVWPLSYDDYTSVLALTGSTTFVVLWFCLPQCTNTSTLTLIALRQMRCRCSLNCLALWIHNPACSVALKRRLHFLQNLITVTCKRFSTQQLSEPNHVSNCVGPAWLRVGRLTSVCDSYPYFIRALNFLSNSPCLCEVCKIKQQLWTTIPEAELPSDFMTDVYLFSGTKEFTQLPSVKQKKLNPQWRILETVCLSIRSPSIKSNSCQNGLTKLMNLGQCWSSAIIWTMVHVLSRIIAWLCWIHKQIPAQYPTNKKLRRRVGHKSWQELIFWTVFSIQIFSTDNPSFCCVNRVHPDDCCLQKSIETNPAQIVVFNIQCYRHCGAMVLAAACFHHRTEAEVGVGFRMWMAVAQSYPNMPHGVGRWQCLGLVASWLSLLSSVWQWHCFITKAK